jgi:SpoVK/Ycf46/Vps4 family AAA+-type ATPase
MQILNQLLRWVARFLGLSRTPATTDELTTLARKIEPRADLQLRSLSVNQIAILNDVSQRARDTSGQRGNPTLVFFTGAGSADQTDAAEALANDLKKDLYRVDLNMVVSKYVGETEKNLARLFRAAEAAGAILFFEEADALFAKRSETKDSHDRYANIEINYLLQRLETYDGLAILATNSEDAIEKVRDRLHLVVEFPCRPCP